MVDKHLTAIKKNRFFDKLRNIVANYHSTLYGIIEIDLKDFKNDI